jgi:hypothetical protein
MVEGSFAEWTGVHDLRRGLGLRPGEKVAHITTNFSPGSNPEDRIEVPYEIDFFHANEIAKVEDVETGAMLFEHADE